MDGFSTLVENQTAVDAWVHFWILSYISFVYRNCVYPHVITWITVDHGNFENQENLQLCSPFAKLLCAFKGPVNMKIVFSISVKKYS